MRTTITARQILIIKHHMKIKKTLLVVFVMVATFSRLKAQVARIPFEFDGTHLYIKVRVNESDTLHFVFDTGSTGGATIDSSAAGKAGIGKENLQTVSIAGNGGVQSYNMALNQTLKLGNIEFKNINIVLANFASLSASSGARIDGIAGDDILDKYVTELDFDHKALSLYKDIKFLDTTGYTPIPFEFSKNIHIPRFPISITLANGETFTGMVMFDTGNSLSLIVSTPFSKFHDFNSKLGETYISRGRGFSAETQEQVAVIKSMSFNGFHFGKMSVRLTVNDKATPADGYLGILGIEVIKHFNVILDYSHKMIYLKPNKNYNSTFKIEGAERMESQAFLQKNKTRPGIKVTPSGLQYKIIKQGNGQIPALGDKVRMLYTIKLVNGKKLWSVSSRNKPWEHHLDKALDGVKEAVLMMPVGSKWILYLPSSLAFGDAAYDEIPAGAALIYEVELIGIDK
jgi:FKBP-type peptidyl-prolyl cis-trans isomerase